MGTPCGTLYYSDDTAHNEPLIRIYTVCHSYHDLQLSPFWQQWIYSKCRDGRIYFRKSGLNGLGELDALSGAVTLSTLYLPLAP